jgi:cysteine-rich repeat protein
MLACVGVARTAPAQVTEGPIDADLTDDLDSYAGGRTDIPTLFGGSVTVTPNSPQRFTSVDAGNWRIFWGGNGQVVPTSDGRFATNFGGSGPTRLTFDIPGGAYGFAMRAVRINDEASTLTFYNAGMQVIGTFMPTLGNADSTMTGVSYVSTVPILAVDILGFELAIDDIQVAVGLCGNGTVELGEQCDDNNTAAGDCCSATCQFENGNACDDGSACTTGETCSAGVCGSGAAVGCAACEACNPAVGCVPSPRTDCRESTVPPKNLLVVANKSASKRSLTWLWRKGGATTLADFGDPTTATAYALCVFDQAGTSVLMRATAPAGGDWKANGTKGFRYKSKTGAPSGLTALTLKSGPAGKASIAVKGKGSLLGTPGLPLTLPVSIQLQAAGGACWKSSYGGGGVKKNGGTLFKGTGQ